MKKQLDYIELGQDVERIISAALERQGCKSAGNFGPSNLRLERRKQLEPLVFVAVENSKRCRSTAISCKGFAGEYAPI